MTTTTRNIIEELKRAATEQGAGEAVRTIAGPALETWMRALDGRMRTRNGSTTSPRS